MPNLVRNRSEAGQQGCGAFEPDQRLAAEIQKIHVAEHGPDVVGQLKDETERLRAEVKELRQKVEKR